MSTAAYRNWVQAGRPWELCQPAVDYRAALNDAGWSWLMLGTIGDEAHLTAETPQDHCPFSSTGWPRPNPYPWVHALDVSHRAGGDQDVGPLVAYWLAEAMAGRTPWVKYIIWRGQRFDVRNGWSPVAASGHFDHAHISFRTDHTSASIGDWQPAPTGGNDMDQSDKNVAWATTNRALAILKGVDAAYRIEGEPVDRLEVNGPANTLRGILSAVQALADRPPVTVDADRLAAALAANDAFINKVASAVAAQIEPSLTLTEVGDWLASKFTSQGQG